jgi:hypothetical protein
MGDRGGGVAQDNKIFVAGISFDWDHNDLGRAFSKFGKVVDAKVIYHRNLQTGDQGKSRGFGFVRCEHTQTHARTHTRTAKEEHLQVGACSAVLSGDCCNVDARSASLQTSPMRHAMRSTAGTTQSSKGAVLP